MQKRTRSLLEELNSLGDSRDINHIVESRALNVITSAINLLEMIQRNYPSDKAEILEKKLLNAIRSKDQGKFSKSLRKNTNEDQ